MSSIDPLKIVIINGPNINLIGIREPEIYGDVSFEDFYHKLLIEFSDVDLDHFQSNHEGAIIDKLQEIGFSANGIILNGGAYSHTSIAIADTIRAIETPVLEIHISDTKAREDFRKKSFLTDACVHLINGKGLEGYREAIQFFTSGAS